MQCSHIPVRTSRGTGTIHLRFPFFQYRWVGKIIKHQVPRVQHPNWVWMTKTISILYLILMLWNLDLSLLPPVWWTMYRDLYADLRAWMNPWIQSLARLRNYWILATNLSTTLRNTALSICVLQPLNPVERRGFCHFLLPHD